MNDETVPANEPSRTSALQQADNEKNSAQICEYAEEFSVPLLAFISVVLAAIQAAIDSRHDIKTTDPYLFNTIMYGFIIDVQG